MRNKEKKAAQQLIDALDSSTVDYEEVGKILSNTQPTFVARRLSLILESAKYYKEQLANNYDYKR